MIKKYNFCMALMSHRTIPRGQQHVSSALLSVPFLFQGVRGEFANIRNHKKPTVSRSLKSNREIIKFDVTWSYGKRQTAKMKLLPSVFSSLNTRVKIFEFVANSRRHFSTFM